MDLGQEKIIGGGGFGKVYITYDCDYGSIAVKRIKKNVLDKTFIDNEINIMKLLKNKPNIINFYYDKEDDKYFYIAMEYANKGELYNYIEKIYNTEIVLHYFRQLVNALSILHSNNIAHRDIKFENILLDDKYTLKLCDFGLACQNIAKSDKCGSPLYIAPEIIKNDSYMPINADIWALGVILFILMTGEIPIEETANDDDQYYNIIKHKEFNKFPWNLFKSEYAKDLCKKMLDIDPKTRINIENIKNHPWFNGIDNKFLDIPTIYLSEHMNMKNFYIIDDVNHRNKNCVECVCYIGNISSENINSDNASKNIFKIEKHINTFIIFENETFSRIKELITYTLKEHNCKIKIKQNTIVAKSENGKVKIHINFKKDKNNIIVEFIRVNGCVIEYTNLFNKIKNFLQ